MEFTIPLSDVKIEVVNKRREIKNPLFSDGYYCIGPDEFSLIVENVAWFYASGGEYISIFPYPEADNRIIELYLNGSIFGAILHQRKIMPLHGSCFNYLGFGIMLCGEAGVGKSSITTSFCLDGAEFLTDDITPMLFSDAKPCIWAVSDRVKLMSDSLHQLDQKEDGLKVIDPTFGKFYFPMHSDKGRTIPLSQTFILELHDGDNVIFQKLEGVSKFTALRNEIYRKEYLQGMAENEQAFFKQIVSLCKTVNITRVLRPANITIRQMQKELARELNSSIE